MTKKELFDLLADMPDDCVVCITSYKKEKDYYIYNDIDKVLKMRKPTAGLKQDEVYLFPTEGRIDAKCINT